MGRNGVLLRRTESRPLSGRLLCLRGARRRHVCDVGPRPYGVADEGVLPLRERMHTVPRRAQLSPLDRASSFDDVASSERT